MSPGTHSTSNTAQPHNIAKLKSSASLTNKNRFVLDAGSRNMAAQPIKMFYTSLFSSEGLPAGLDFQKKVNQLENKLKK